MKRSRSPSTSRIQASIASPSPVSAAAAGGRLDEAHRRVGERGHDPRRLEPGSPEEIDALVDELVQVRGKWQLLAGSERAASS